MAVISLKTKILESIKEAQNQEIMLKEIYLSQNLYPERNEFLFFIKPEITLKSETVQLDKILDLILESLKAFNFEIHDVKTLSSIYLEKYNLIAQHYGVINKISSDVLNNISETAKAKFKEIYGKSIFDVKAMGSLEVLDQYKNLNPYSLDYLWQNIENHKLASGTYCEAIKIEDDIIHIFNGFHPRQLKHFTISGRSIVVFSLSSNISWSEARNDFIGSTNPENAKKGSLRRELLDNMSTFSLPEVSQSFNGVHLSAGPVESLVELKRYTSNFTTPSKIKAFSDFSFGRLLLANFYSQFDDIVNNENINADGKTISIFDLTEEKNAEEAINILKKYVV